jgi:hypothetical protein
MCICVRVVATCITTIIIIIISIIIITITTIIVVIIRYNEATLRLMLRLRKPDPVAIVYFTADYIG